jgi:hypothetical protein
MLKKEFIRDGTRRIIGSVTTGYSDTSAVVRNEENRITGRTSDRFHTPATATGTCYPSIPPIRVS